METETTMRRGRTRPRSLTKLIAALMSLALLLAACETDEEAAEDPAGDEPDDAEVDDEEETGDEEEAGDEEAAEEDVEVAEDFPERPIELTVGWSAGGSSDLTSRGLAREMEDDLGETIQINNVEGATGGVGAGQVYGAEPDGHTIFGGASVHGMWPVMEQAEVGWEDFYAFIAGSAPTTIYVAENSDYETIEDVVAAMEDDPDMRYGTPGPGSNGHIFGEALLEETGTQAEHVPYDGGSEAGQFLASGEIEWASVTLGDLTDQAEAGELRPLVNLFDEPVDAGGHEIAPITDHYPELEQQMAINPSFGLYVSRDTPGPVVARLAESVEYATEQERFRELYEDDLGGVVDFTVGQEADEIMALLESGRGWALHNQGLAETDPEELGIPTLEEFSWPPHERAEQANPWPEGL